MAKHHEHERPQAHDRDRSGELKDSRNNQAVLANRRVVLTTEQQHLIHHESIEVAEGLPFHLKDHLARLAESAEMIELKMPYAVNEIAGWIKRLIPENGNRDCLLRVIALGVT